MNKALEEFQDILEVFFRLRQIFRCRLFRGCEGPLVFACRHSVEDDALFGKTIVHVWNVRDDPDRSKHCEWTSHDAIGYTRHEIPSASCNLPHDSRQVQICHSDTLQLRCSKAIPSDCASWALQLNDYAVSTGTIRGTQDCSYFTPELFTLGCRGITAELEIKHARDWVDIVSIECVSTQQGGSSRCSIEAEGGQGKSAQGPFQHTLLFIS
mmetsp:Transcript_17269/g.23236  ORF Transcript_17269/g.23236 Transcript_17269/m.23236 type:complete len:211 (-) Transcript_17269:919-1551(-)